MCSIVYGECCPTWLDTKVEEVLSILISCLGLGLFRFHRLSNVGPYRSDKCLRFYSVRLG